MVAAQAQTQDRAPVARVVHRGDLVRDEDGLWIGSTATDTPTRIDVVIAAA